MPRRTANGYDSHCPCHDDKHGSLSLSLDGDSLLVHCHAGCPQDSVFEAVVKLLASPKATRLDPKDKQIVAIYPYADSSGHVVFEKVRFEPKGFSQRRSDGKGGYVYSLKGVDQNILYQLPEVLQAIRDKKTIFIAEGEKDCNELMTFGLVATCNSQGASQCGKKPKWNDGHTNWLKGASMVVIFPDNDETGKAHAQAIAVSAHRGGIPCKVVELQGLPEKGDLSDWRSAGGTKEKLEKLINAAPYWKPEVAPIQLTAEEQAVLAQLKQSENLFEVLKDDLLKLGYIADQITAYTIGISHVARLLPKSSGYVWYGASASGKSDGILKAALMLPPEVVLIITSVSEAALYYQGDLKHRYVIFGEVAPQKDGEDDPRQRAWRQLLSEDRINRHIVEKSNGKLESSEKFTEGPCVIVAVTTSEPNAWNDELQNRNSWIRSDDSEDMTAHVLRLQAAQAEKPWVNNLDEQTLVTRKWQGFHRELISYPVVIPFASQIKPNNRHVTARRLFPQVLMYTRAAALLHQSNTF